MRAARVLKFVDEHVTVARLQAVAALGELAHLLQQLDRAFEHAGEVEQRVRVERPLIFAQRDRENPPDAAGQHDVQVAAKRANRFGDGWRERRGRLPVPLPRVLGVAVAAVEAGAGEILSARIAVLLQEVRRAADRPARGIPPGRRALSRASCG